jgi:transposase-like protein
MAKRRDAAREARWRELVAEQRGSGLSVRAFCRREQLAEASLYAWRRELARRDGEPAQAGHRPAFVPVTVAPPEIAGVAGDAGQVIVELGDGRVLRLPLATPAARVAELVQALGAVEAGS